jgi:hypothetical protein
MEKILTYNHYKKYKILYHYTYLQLYYTYYHSCYLRVTCTKDHLNLNGLQTISNEIETQLGIYLKLFVILYADDTVLMAESSADLQNQLNSFQDYLY